MKPTNKRFPHIVIQRVRINSSKREIVAHNDDGGMISIIVKNRIIESTRKNREPRYRLEVEVGGCVFYDEEQEL